MGEIVLGIKKYLFKRRPDMKTESQRSYGEAVEGKGVEGRIPSNRYNPLIQLTIP
jgi:hypothetical protein